MGRLVCGLYEIGAGTVLGIGSLLKYVRAVVPGVRRSAEAGDAEVVGRDLGGAAENEVGQQPAGAAGHRPAQRALPGVEPEVGEAGAADHRHAIGRRWPQPGSSVALGLKH